ncbi:MAG: hypothetical protein GY861_04475, partial [bacterium]|nr:hypothetical protein [bacterium]
MDEAIELLNEVETYNSCRKNLLVYVDKLKEDYQKEKFGYFDYRERLGLVLKNKTKQEWSNYYNAYQMSLLKKAELLISQAFSLVYNDDSSLKLKQEEAPIQQ